MRVIGIDRIHEFMGKHTDSQEWLKAWLAEARSAEWRGPKDIKARYRKASILKDSKVIFDVKGNKYRMEIQVSYKNKVVVVKRIGTHGEYDRWDT